MNQNNYKKTYKPPACTQAPWKNLIPVDKRDEVMRKIRQETIEAYGYSMDECPKRKVCFTQACIGRSLPWKSETAKPYLEQLKTTHNIVNNELFINNCDSCEIVKSCTSPCAQVNDYINRFNDKEPELVYSNKLDDLTDNKPIESDSNPIALTGTIPWDCLSPLKQSLIQKYMYERKDFLAVSKELGLNNQAEAKYLFYAALTKLSKFAAIRAFINENRSMLTQPQLKLLLLVFINNLTITEAAKQCDITKQAAQQLISRLLAKFEVRWQVFVKKKGNKVLYNVPEVLR
jgi:predicted DNA-binding protein YlxM (UPF0122 family)